METQEEPINLNTPDVLAYESSRAYLADFLSWKRRSARGFSVRQFCLKAGISTENYLLRILRGQRNLGPKLAERLLPILGLSGTRADYFKGVVLAESARTTGERARHLSELSALRRLAGTVDAVSDNEIFRSWHFLAIWELASCKDFILTPKGAVEALRGKISIQEAKEAIEALIRKGYLVEREGRWVQADINLVSSDGRADPIVRLSHRETVTQALEAIDEPFETRSFYGLTIAIDRNRLPYLNERLRRFTEELNAEFALDFEADTVYRINAHCFLMADAKK